ncbi:MAG: hypothetical protein KDK70_29850, partial [Myxococcales bacterium]|nr:hypothetical protein [Myxococcales bacterium]
MSSKDATSAPSTAADAETIVEGPDGERGFEVIVGGGLGRTPFVGKVIRDFLPKRFLLSYLEAILRVYNQHGR